MKNSSFFDGFYCKKWVLKQVLSLYLATIFHVISSVSNWGKTKFQSRHTVNFVQRGNPNVQCSSSSFLSQRTKCSIRSTVLEVAILADFSPVPPIQYRRTCVIFCILFSCPYVSLSLTNLGSQLLKVYIFNVYTSSC